MCITIVRQRLEIHASAKKIWHFSFEYYSHIARFSAIFNRCRRNIGKCFVLLCTHFGNSRVSWSEMVSLFLRIIMTTVHLIKHILLDAQDITVGAFITARLNSQKYRGEVKDLLEWSAPQKAK